MLLAVPILLSCSHLPPEPAPLLAQLFVLLSMKRLHKYLCVLVYNYTAVQRRDYASKARKQGSCTTTVCARSVLHCPCEGSGSRQSIPLTACGETKGRLLDLLSGTLHKLRPLVHPLPLVMFLKGGRKPARLKKP